MGHTIFISQHYILTQQNNNLYLGDLSSLYEILHDIGFQTKNKAKLKTWNYTLYFSPIKSEETSIKISVLLNQHQQLEDSFKQLGFKIIHHP